jgi:hypothetical protein
MTVKDTRQQVIIRRRFSLNEEEADEFMRRIEMENISPLTQFNEMFDDVILDDDDDED